MRCQYDDWELGIDNAHKRRIEAEESSGPDTTRSAWPAVGQSALKDCKMSKQ